VGRAALVAALTLALAMFEGTVGGESDFEPGQACIDLAYADTSNSMKPRGC
jgi:hypothetical protein